MVRRVTSDAVRVAELQLVSELGRAVLASPVLSYTIAFVILETTQKAKITGNVETTAVELGLGAIAAAQAAAPVVGALGGGTGIAALAGR